MTNDFLNATARRTDPQPLIDPKFNDHPDDPGHGSADDQLSLRFFCIIDGMNGSPPDRGLWRVLLDTALKDRDRFVCRGKIVAASLVHHVACAVYLRSNRAGIVDGFSAERLAEDCHRSERAVRAALGVCRDLRIVRMQRASRRRPAVWRLNVGGLDWPAVRARVEAQTEGGSSPSIVLSPALGTALSPALGTALKGTYVQQVLQDHDAAADSRADQRQQRSSRPSAQQQHASDQNHDDQEHRFEGLIGFIACAAREAKRDFDEDDHRSRWKDGTLTLARLQALADELRVDRDAAKARAATGPSWMHGEDYDKTYGGF